METPLVSVIVPVYNAEKYIRMLVDSVLAQSYTNFELLLIDDGSKDSSPQIIDQYAEQDSRVKVIHKVNGGVSSARNCGLDHACGIFIAFADNDDYMYPDNLQTMVEEIEDYDLLICNYIRCRREEVEQYDKKRNRQKTFEVTGKGDTMGEAIQNIGYKHGAIWNQLFRKEVIDRIKLRFDQIEYEDEMFSFENLSHVSSVKRIDFEGYCWINNPGSQGSSHRYIAEMNWISRMEGIYERMEQKYPPQQQFKNIVNMRIAHRLAVLCVKGYYPDSHKFVRQRMAIWKSVENDPWMKNRIDLSLIGKYDRIVLFIAKHPLLYIMFDPIFQVYGRTRFSLKARSS